MKKLIAVLCVGLAVGAVAEVEYGQLTGTNVVAVAEGELFTLMANSFTSGGGLWVRVAGVDYGMRNMIYNNDGNASAHQTTESITVVGPCDIRLIQIAGGFCSYKIIRPDVTVQTGPMNIISLPDDNNGDVELLVESSTDLQNWTPVYSGSAGTSNNAAFFRTRLIQN